MLPLVQIIGMIACFLIGRVTKEEAMLPFIVQGAFFGAVLSVPFVIITGLLKISGLFAIVVFIVLSPLLGFIFTYIFSLLFIRWFRNCKSKENEFPVKKTADYFQPRFTASGTGATMPRTGWVSSLLFWLPEGFSPNSLYRSG